MKMIMRFISYIIFLCLLFSGCKGSMVIDFSNQLNYSYSSESFGYNDIKKLYSSDTVNAKKPFFKSESLQDAEVIIKSHLKKIILEQNMEGQLICYQLINPSFILKSGGIITDTEFISKELIKPVFVQIDNYGKIGLITLDSSITVMTTGIIKDIISRMQFVKPVKKSKNWQTVEENTNGTYTANYNIAVSSSTGNIYNKEIVKYLKYKSKRKNQNIDTNNNTSIETDGGGTVKTISTSEAQVVLNNPDTISASGTKVSVLLTSKTKLNNSTKEDLLNIKKSTRYSNQTTLSAPVSLEKITKMVHTGTLGLDNWQQLFQRLSTPNDLTKGEEVSLVEKFRAIFYLYPDTCKKAVSLIEKEPYDTVISRVLRRALSMTKTFEATDAMADIITNNKNNEKVLEEFLPALATTSFPTSKAADLIKSLAFGTDETQDYFITSTAQLTLGGMANKFMRSDSLRAKKLTAYLIEKLKFEKDTIQHLLVLGNTGSPKVFPFIKSLVEHSQTSDQVKIEAVSALSLIKDEQVSLYLEKLLQNKNVAIREKTKEVLEFRNSKFKY